MTSQYEKGKGSPYSNIERRLPLLFGAFVTFMISLLTYFYLLTFRQACSYLRNP